MAVINQKCRGMAVDKRIWKWDANSKVTTKAFYHILHYGAVDCGYYFTWKLPVPHKAKRYCYG